MTAARDAKDAAADVGLRAASQTRTHISCKPRSFPIRWAALRRPGLRSMRWPEFWAPDSVGNRLYLATDRPSSLLCPQQQPLRAAGLLSRPALLRRQR